ncbi:histone deacetylase family protein [Piscinibacter sakaiensis]|uniref:histone deacetylase family protein n=1 Tax=Piscinibacter sakaiensis TaxID=1547922 RepID=UPI003AAFB7DD
MLIYANAMHHLHHGRQEMFRGRLVPCVEVPQRVDHVLAELARRPLGEQRQAPADGLDAALLTVHAPDYLQFLATAWDQWLAIDPANAEYDVLPSVWPVRGMRRDIVPANFSARVGLYSFDAGTPLTAGSWTAAREGAACALAAARAVSAGEAGSALALSRPPGHHAGAEFFGGYCFLNNSALAAQVLRDSGCERVSVLDIDYHHGNGTQSIFYERADVQTISLHGDPRTEYPFYLGFADERGAGAGVGFNLNLPLPRGTGFADWRAALATALDAVTGFAPQALVIAVGVDTFEGDPISGFRLRSADYLDIGRDIRRAVGSLPLVWVFEGGYAVDEIGVNLVNILEGFSDAA